MATSLRASDRSLTRRLARAFVAVGALIAATLLLTGACFALVLGHYEPSIHDLLAGRDGLDLAHNGMLDEETGLRGYLDTGTQVFLGQYYAGQKEIQAGDDAALGLATHADLVEPMVDLRVAQQRWLSEWATPAIAFERAATTDALDAFLLRGKTLFDGYRAAKSIADTAVAADINTEQTSEHSVVIAMLGAVLVALVITIGVARRQHRALRNAVVAPITDLLSTMRRVGAGDLDARPTSSGPPELREVATELTRMTDTLAAERSRITSMESVARSQAARLGLIVSVGREISGSLSLRYVAEAVSKAALSIGGFEAVSIWITDDDRRQLTVVHDTGVDPVDLVDRTAVQLGEGLVGRAGQFGRTLATLTSGALATEYRTGTKIAALAVPMIVGARIVGVLELISSEPLEIDEGRLDVMYSLAGQAASAIEAARFHQRADELSYTDVLTRLPNRRRLELDLDAEVDRMKQSGHPIAFIMLDVDHFKNVNDVHGHQAGDEILSEFQTAFNSSLRDTDTAYRFGGEEFCVLLRDSDGGAAMRVAERLRITIAQRFAGGVGSAGVTASLGVASIPDDAADAKALIAAADQALYRAKAAGRNCVVRANATPDAERAAPSSPLPIAVPVRRVKRDPPVAAVVAE